MSLKAFLSCLMSKTGIDQVLGMQSSFCTVSQNNVVYAAFGNEG